MTWLAVRQFRLQAGILFGALAALAIYVIISGLQLRNLYPSDWMTTCNQDGTCGAIGQSIRDFDHIFQAVFDKLFLLLLPAITGVFWGAPLVARELETGTFRLTWTQSITRTRWFATKVAVVGLGSIAASALLSVMATWWYRPLEAVGQSRFEASAFSLRDIAPIGYAAFAFAVGVTAGLLIRRTLPAMAATLVVFIAVRVVVQNWVRPNFQTALHMSGPFQPIKPVDSATADVFTNDLIKPGDWIISDEVLDPSGKVLTQIIAPNGPCTTSRTCFDGYTHVVNYQPAGRYWAFQWYETSLFVGLAAVLLGFCFWRLRRA